MDAAAFHPGPTGALEPAAAAAALLRALSVPAFDVEIREPEGSRVLPQVSLFLKLGVVRRAQAERAESWSARKDPHARAPVPRVVATQA